MPPFELYQGDALTVLTLMQGESVQCVVTSPPYWGLRDYKVAGQIGLEPTPELYVEHLVAVFREVRRVFRKDGTLWLNLGDSYASDWPCNRRNVVGQGSLDNGKRENRPPRLGNGLKPKDLVGIPWRVAFALQADGWWLRSDIIWSKPNPMPESVTDRPTKAHEYLFLFAKGEWKSRVVQFSHLPSERVHLGKYVGFNTADMGGHKDCIFLASQIFNRSQAKQNGSLPAFDAEVWQQRPDGSDSDFVRGLPAQHISTVWASRFLQGHTSPKVFLEQLDRVGFALGESCNLLIGGVAAELPDAPAFDADGKGTVTIHHSGQVSKIEFTHGRIVYETPRQCNYYYDAEAIKEDGTMRETFGNSGTKVLDNFNRNDGARQDKQRGHSRRHAGFNDRWDLMSKEEQCALRVNKRTVWEIATQPYPEAHFATFPEALVEPCILAGSKPGDVILDPFCGSGTVGVVALHHDRQFIGIDLSGQYIDMARARIVGKEPLFRS